MSRKNWTNEKIFFRLINNKSDKTYWENIRELRSRPTIDVFNHSVKLINSSKPRERNIGIDILAQLGFPPRPFFKESGKQFFEILNKEKDPKVLRSVLYAIGHNNNKLKFDEIAILASHKNSADNGIREGLVSALLSVDNNLAIDTLIHLTSDKISHIRDWATFGIGTQIERDNKLIREALWLRVEDEHQDTRLEAIFGLSKRKDKRIKAVIERELLNKDGGSLLFQAIDELNDKDFLPILKKLYSESKNNNNNSDWVEDLTNCINKLKEV